jgi:hypothetical protein
MCASEPRTTSRKFVAIDPWKQLHGAIGSCAHLCPTLSFVLDSGVGNNSMRARYSSKKDFNLLTPSIESANLDHLSETERVNL